MLLITTGMLAVFASHDKPTLADLIRSASNLEEFRSTAFRAGYAQPVLVNFERNILEELNIPSRHSHPKENCRKCKTKGIIKTGLFGKMVCPVCNGTTLETDGVGRVDMAIGKGNAGVAEFIREYMAQMKPTHPFLDLSRVIAVIRSLWCSVKTTRSKREQYQLMKVKRTDCKLDQNEEALLKQVKNEKHFVKYLRKNMQMNQCVILKRFREMYPIKSKNWSIFPKIRWMERYIY